ncbi:MAG: ASCH domain-containing protein [Acutalibacteraceae bacterium]|nr:ASCH domain-containing protein [Acutalibacteraceae bacterium]
MTIHKMKLYNEPFEMIKNGLKTIELRLNDEKRQKLAVDDVIEFTEIKSENKINVQVIALHKYPDFAELYKHFEKTQLGYKEDEIAQPEDMEEYYSPENIKKYGVLGIEVKVI